MEPVFKSVTLLITVFVILLCLVAIGVGTRAIAALFLAFGGMGGIALIIAWVFLRKPSPQEVGTGRPSKESPAPMSRCNDEIKM